MLALSRHRRRARLSNLTSWNGSANAVSAKMQSSSLRTSPTNGTGVRQLMPSHVAYTTEYCPHSLNLKKISGHDAVDPFTPPPEGGVGRESVGEVALRTASGFTELLDRIGATTIGTNVVLVAHGDTLSTLAAVLAFCQREESERTIQAFTDALRVHRSHGLKQAEYVTFPRVGVSHETALT